MKFDELILSKVSVQISSATRDMMLIQQNKFYWMSSRSGVAELVWTVILSKIIKTVAIRCQILRLKCTKFDFGCKLPQTLSWI